MPIFEFMCHGCGKSFEILVRSRNPRIQCRYCSGMDVGRILSTFGVASANRGESSCHSNSGSGCGSCSGGTCSTCG